MTSGEADQAAGDGLREKVAPDKAIGEAARAFLHSPGFRPATIIETDAATIVLDLSHDSALLEVRAARPALDWLTERIETAMQAAGTRFAYGRYGEPRGIYDNEHFAGPADRRTVHMGIDLFCAAGTIVHAPLDGVVHLVAENARELDYGPLLMLRHDLNGGQSFYTLYGHLSKAGTASLRVGDHVVAGQPVSTVGAPPENGNWPPHLHFQLILDLLGLGADFPGVAAASDREFWLSLSPSPAAFFPLTDAAELVCPP